LIISDTMNLCMQKIALFHSACKYIKKTTTFAALFQFKCDYMNKYGIISIPLVPVRVTDSEKAEMSTQLLFGEIIEVLEIRDYWAYICNLNDNYIGWISTKMFTSLSDSLFKRIMTHNRVCITRPYAIIYNAFSNESMMIPGGSYIYQPEGDDFEIGSEKWSLIEPFSMPELKVEAYRIPQFAAQFLNSPYLWGGKSLMGIDCSGLTQIAFAMGGYQIQRDAAQQVDSGSVVDFLTEALPGDLAFFENESGSIVHVGILLDTSRIIHASGKVRVDIIDSQGIKQTAKGDYTHKLRVIKRIISPK